jgi:U6 snRNA-associated Sm-like protein LSm2
MQVELKNDLRVTGLLHSVDQYLNIKLTDIAVEDAAKFPHMVRRQSSENQTAPLSRTVC